jgi:hypothetical protein
MKIVSDNRGFTLCLLCAIIGILLWQLSHQIFDTNVPIKSMVNGKYYKVKKDGFEQVSADKLAVTEYKLNELYNKVCKNYGDSQGFYPNSVPKLKRRWPKIQIREVTNGEPEAAYVLNKGPDMRFCLQSKDPDDTEKDNILMFIAIHEMAHIMSDSFGHGPEFIKNFKGLLDVATKQWIINPLNGKNELVYTPQDFSSKPKKYCGVKINKNIM